MSRPAARFFNKGTRSVIRPLAFRAGTPAQIERGEQIIESFGVEDHRRLEDALDERLQGLGGQSVLTVAATSLRRART